MGKLRILLSRLRMPAHGSSCARLCVFLFEILILCPGTNRITPTLSKEAALEAGAEFIGESFIFGVVVVR